MKKCALCQSNEANQTGSHIYTYSLIKTAINEAGKIVRDKELSFSLNVLDFGNVYFGRKVQPEKIEEVLGKAITEEDIKNNENHYTVDYLVCGNCEKRFTIAENYFISNVHQKLQQSKFKTKPDSKKNSIIDLPENELDLDLIRLFIYMQIWRASAARYNGFRLKPKLEKQLRRILDENLDWDLDFKKTIANCRKNSHEIRKYPLSITFCETDIKTENKFELTTNVVVTTNSKIPYFFVLNDIYVQFYAKESHIKSSIDYLFGLNDIIPKKEHINIRLNERNFL